MRPLCLGMAAHRDRGRDSNRQRDGRLRPRRCIGLCQWVDGRRGKHGSLKRRSRGDLLLGSGANKRHACLGTCGSADLFRICHHQCVGHSSRRFCIFRNTRRPIDACSKSNGPCGGSASNSATLTYNASPGAIYDIEVNAGGGSGVGSGTWFASADPEAEIDPSFAYAKDFTLEFSPGPNSGAGGTNPPPTVPEPSNVTLLSVGLSALLGLRLMSKRQVG